MKSGIAIRNPKNQMPQAKVRIQYAVPDCMSKHFLRRNAAINRNIEDSDIPRCFPWLSIRAGAPPIGKKPAHGQRQGGYSDCPREESRIPVQASRGPDQYGNAVAKKNASQNDGSARK